MDKISVIRNKRARAGLGKPDKMIQHVSLTQWRICTIANLKLFGNSGDDFECHNQEWGH